ncbi:MAG: ABC transporter ATP-binding protein [Betaproteobacteria bacterium]|nr:ABC transporter ATP-binding protein [Pseudomonadota bacterium]
MSQDALSDNALSLSGINALYGDSHVLHDVSFALKKGRVLALLGRNGAGKTTCMNAIIGFLRPRDGDIRLHGEQIARLSPEVISRRGVGLVPQGRRIFPNLSVYENLIVAQRKPVGEVAREWTLKDVFDTFPRLGERQQQAAGSLSGGEQQMLAIGRALVSNPRVLLMDEPSEGLAPLIVHEVGETILKLKAQGFSILLVEQNTALALRVADDVVILNTGRVVHDGSADGVRAQPDLLQAHLGIF